MFARNGKSIFGYKIIKCLHSSIVHVVCFSRLFHHFGRSPEALKVAKTTFAFHLYIFADGSILVCWDEQGSKVIELQLIM